MHPLSKSISIFIFLLSAIALSLWQGLALYYPVSATALFTLVLTKDRSTYFVYLQKNLSSLKGVFILLTLISLVIPMLMLTGVLPSMIYYFSKFLAGLNLYLAAFSFALILSMILGSAIGTLTILLPLFFSFVLPDSQEAIRLAGALISGAYFGDRASPLSSILHLTTSMVGVDYRKSVKVLLKSSLVPLLLTVLVYLFLIPAYRLSGQALKSVTSLTELFFIHPLMIAPLLFLIAAILFGVNIKKALAFLLGGLLLLAVIQGSHYKIMVTMMLGGYRASEDLGLIQLHTTGFFKMASILLVIFSSALLNAALETGAHLAHLLEPLQKPHLSPKALSRRAMVVSMLLTIITCNQALTAMITGHYFSKTYKARALPLEDLVKAIGNTGLSMVALVPWNVNGLVVASLTGIPTLVYGRSSYFLLLLISYTLLTTYLRRPKWN